MFNLLQKRISFMERLDDNIDLGMQLHSKQELSSTYWKKNLWVTCMYIDC
jgi:hypothetical protein